MSKHVAAVPLILALLMGAAIVVPASAEEAGPPRLSTNPGKHVIFPAKGQNAEQQEKDQLEAYAWATQQTGWDPYKAAVGVAQTNAAAEQASADTRGAAVGGALRGALVGAAVGSIAGDTGKGAGIGAAAGGLTRGMRGRQERKQASATVDQAEAAYTKQFQLWDKHFVVAMEGKGYTVK